MSRTSGDRRVLVVDDDLQLHEAYRRVLGDPTASSRDPTELDALAAELFGGSAAAKPAEAQFELSDVVYCRQGLEAVAAVEQSRREGRPFAIVFLDMRMPPGIDGLETAQRVRRIDPDVNIVIVTGYSDHRPAEITAIVGRPERLFYLVKPFDGDELKQLTTALCSRWVADRGAAEELARRVVELERANAALIESEARARQAARQDALTGLSNRTGLAEQFDLEASGTSATGKSLAVLYLDLDRFKDINDSLGHLVGDQLIRAFAQRVREATGEDGFTARLGGDEFAVICTKPDRVAALVERLTDAGTAPFTIGSHVIKTSASIGVARSEPGRPNLVEGMRRADIALYEAKAAGRGVAREFLPTMETEFLNSQRLARDLSKAIADDQLVLHYQPQVHSTHGTISGVEALLRWTHPEHGMIPPLVFIGVAERSNIIAELGSWVMRRAFADSRRWPHLVTAINLSPAQLRQPGFAAGVAALAQELGVEAGMIEFEVTETVLIEDMPAAARQIRELKTAGYRIALDDFGSGYASLAYLSQIPFDKLKIDRSFVQDLHLKPSAGGVIKSIVSLASAMGLTTTAEGVEDVTQFKFLETAGCTEMQGFFFHKPCPAEEIEALLAPSLASGLSATPQRSSAKS